MAPENERDLESNARAVERLLERARSFGFMELVTRLERLIPAEARVGEAASPSQEPIRFRHDPNLQFSAGDVSEARLSKRKDGGLRAEVTTAFLGLTGAASPLPSYLAEEVLHEDPEEPVVRDFLDIFHHRMISLLFRGLVSRDYARDYEHSGEDAMSRRLLCLMGSDPALPGARPLAKTTMLRLAALKVVHADTAEALEIGLQDAAESLFGDVVVRVEDFAGEYYDLGPDQRTQLGLNTHLGLDCALGRRLRHRGGKIRIVVGPFSARAYGALRADEQRVADFRSVIEWLLADPVDFDVVLSLVAEAAPRLQLDSRTGSRLGTDSWMGRPQVETVEFKVPEVRSSQTSRTSMETST